MSTLESLGITLDPLTRLATHGGWSVKLTATGAMLLEWLDEAINPTLEFCCDENWESVDTDYVRGQIEKLAKALEPLELSLVIDDQDLILLTSQEGPNAGGAEADISPASDAVEKHVADPAPVFEAVQTLEIAALQQRVAELEAERDGINTALKARDAYAADLETRLEQECQRSAALSSKAQALANNPVYVTGPERIPDTPLALAPRHITIPVAEPLFRWLEGVALRNRISPEALASKLILAFWRTAKDDAKSKQEAA
jgi:hypothetical protein